MSCVIGLRLIVSQILSLTELHKQLEAHSSSICCNSVKAVKRRYCNVGLLSGLV